MRLIWMTWKVPPVQLGTCRVGLSSYCMRGTDIVEECTAHSGALSARQDRCFAAVFLGLDAGEVRRKVERLDA